MITEAWVRVQERPALEALGRRRLRLVRAPAPRRCASSSQSGLNPSNCRLLDPAEAELTHAGPPGKALLVLGLRVGAPPGRRADARSRSKRPRDHGGEVTGAAPSVRGAEETAGRGERPGRRSGATPSSPLPTCATPSSPAASSRDTFETAITWDRFAEFHAQVMETARRAIAEACGAPPDGPGSPRLSCRFTHVYPDGPAPYYTVLAPARRGGEVEQWDEIKAAVSETVIDAGGTITHHHAVGRDHRPWYDRQRPEPFAEALRRGEAAPSIPRAFSTRASSSTPNLVAHGDAHGGAADRSERRRAAACAGREVDADGAARRDAAAGVDQEPARLRRPAVLAASSTRAAQVVDATLTFAAFCAISSAGYLFNDLRDAPLDRQHPEKRHRPIASGELAPATARGLPRSPWRRPGWAWRCLGVSPEVAGLVALYGVTTAAYSLVLKRLVIIDVMTIASLFILRVVAGAVAVEAHASEWLLVCTGMLALFLGFTKRRQEAMSLRPRPGYRQPGPEGSRTTRPVLEHYSLPFLDQMVAMVTAAAIISYVIYAVNSPLIGVEMLATAPSVLYGIFRYLYLIYDREDTRSTAAILTEDPGMIFAGVTWVGDRAR